MKKTEDTKETNVGIDKGRRGGRSSPLYRSEERIDPSSFYAIRRQHLLVNEVFACDTDSMTRRSDGQVTVFTPARHPTLKVVNGVYERLLPPTDEGDEV